MIALLQRVLEARVSVDNKIVGEIEHGLLVLLAIEPEDTEAKAKRLAERVAMVSKILLPATILPQR